MGTKQENAEKREASKVEHAAKRESARAAYATARTADVEKVEAQLKVWSTRLDELVVGYLEAGAQAHDAYRLRIDALRSRFEAVQTKLNEFKDPKSASAPVGTFRASVSEDWTALESGLEDLTH